jgi:hypothetical protein
MEMRCLETADIFDEKLLIINLDIETTLTHFRELINSLSTKNLSTKKQLTYASCLFINKN